MVVIESLLLFLTANRYISGKLSVSIHLIVIAEDMGKRGGCGARKSARILPDSAIVSLL
jgi:hypothetical protein